MRTFLSISILSVLLLAIFASAPPATHAESEWYDLYTCTDTYITDHLQAWANFDSSARTQADIDDRNSLLDQSFNSMVACNSSAFVDVAELDFCTGAQQAYYSCINQFQGIDATSARMECQAATRYEGTCV
ncbi:MAG: hypothetical protein AABN95_17505 [Acidobacteriota bacterium]